MYFAYKSTVLVVLPIFPKRKKSTKLSAYPNKHPSELVIKNTGFEIQALIDTYSNEYNIFIFNGSIAKWQFWRAKISRIFLFTQGSSKRLMGVFFFEGWRGTVVGAYSNEYSIMKINKPLLILVGFFSNKRPHSFKRSLFSEINL